MTPQRALTILCELCSVATAPFVEARVVDYVRAFVTLRPGLRISQDRYGNLLVLLPGLRPRQPRWIFTAHMDHPGMVVERMVGPHTLAAVFRGGAVAVFALGEKVVFFHDGGETRGIVTRVRVDRKTGDLVALRVKVESAVPPGTLGMWDQGVGRIRGKRFLSRACDDLAGAAGALAMLDELHCRPHPPEAPVAVLLTRAEEDGLIGAIGAAARPELLHRSDRLIAVETSAMQPYAPQGRGPIIRLGDKASVFNSSLSYFLTRQAEALAKKGRQFQFQRALMPGGTCEATVYDAYGFHAAAICIALGNYHNMDRKRRRVGPEYVDVDDYLGMVRFFVAIADQGHTYRPGHHELKAHLARRFADKKHLLTEPRAKRRKLGASPGELIIHGDIVHADFSGDRELRS
jgi:endoglucanase